MTKQCSSCGGFCGNVCQRENVAQPEREQIDAQKLANAIANAATRAGVLDGSIDSLSGPQLLLLLDNLVQMAQPKEPEQEPVAYFNPQVKGGFYWAKPTKITAPITVSVEPMPLYTTPPQPEQEPDDLTIAYMAGLSRGKDLAPQRTWVGLTDDEMQDLWDRYAHMEMMRAIEAKLKEKNT